MGILVRPGLMNHTPEGADMIEKYRAMNFVYGVYSEEDCCFYCSKHLSGEAVLLWMGRSERDASDGGHNLYLHPGCFLELTTRLFRDLHEIQAGMDYRVLRNASPRPPYPTKPTKPAGPGEWVVWRKLRDAMRDLSVVGQ